MILLTMLAATAHADFRFVHTSDQHVSGSTGYAETDANLFREITQLSPRAAVVAGPGNVTANHPHLARPEPIKWLDVDSTASIVH